MHHPAVGQRPIRPRWSARRHFVVHDVGRELLTPLLLMAELFDRKDNR